MRWEDTVEPEWLAWYDLTPAERWAASQTLWLTYLQLGGTLDPDPDPQSPFYDPDRPSQSDDADGVSPDARVKRLWAACLNARREAPDA